MEVYDADDGASLNDFSKQDFIGSHQFTMHKVVTGKNQTIEEQLENPKKNIGGKIRITGKEKKDGFG